jgi:hypothetical protein
METEGDVVQENSIARIRAKEKQTDHQTKTVQTEQ